jgi:hypothetical protein
MPESDPGDGAIDDVDEFMRDIDNIERDETLIELVGEGYDLNAPGDQAVADLLGAWRDDVTSVPVDESRLPSAHTARGELPPAPTTGGTMSASDDAAALRSIELPFGAIQQAQQQLDTALATASQLLGSNGTGLQAVQAAIQQAKQEIDGGYSMVQEVENQLDQAASGLTQG